MEKFLKKKIYKKVLNLSNKVLFEDNVDALKNLIKFKEHSLDSLLIIAKYTKDKKIGFLAIKGIIKFFIENKNNKRFLRILKDIALNAELNEVKLKAYSIIKKILSY